MGLNFQETGVGMGASEDLSGFVLPQPSDGRLETRAGARRGGVR